MTEALVVVSTLILVGVLVKKSKVLSDEADRGLLTLVINVLLPCFIFSKVVGNESVKDPQNMLYAPLAGFLGVAVPIFLCLFLARYVFKLKAFKDETTQRTFAFATGLQNYGYIAIPVIDKVFGGDLLGMMVLHNMGVELAIWSIGITVLSGELNRSSWKRLINGPFIAVILSLFLNVSGGDHLVPAALADVIAQIGAAFIPLGVILVGTTVFTLCHKSNFFSKTLKEGMGIVLLGNLLRSGIIPLIIIGMAMIFPYSLELQKVIIIEAAMPAAFSTIIYSKHYHGKPEVALQISMTSLAVGIILLPVWVSIGKSLLNL